MCGYRLTAGAEVKTRWNRPIYRPFMKYSGRALQVGSPESPALAADRFLTPERKMKQLRLSQTEISRKTAFRMSYLRQPTDV
jgi:hypothetical protein